MSVAKSGPLQFESGVSINTKQVVQILFVTLASFVWAFFYIFIVMDVHYFESLYFVLFFSKNSENLIFYVHKILNEAKGFRFYRNFHTEQTFPPNTITYRESIRLISIHTSLKVSVSRKTLRTSWFMKYCERNIYHSIHHTQQQNKQNGELVRRIKNEKKKFKISFV